MPEDYRIRTSFRNSRKRRRLKRRLGADGVLALIDLWGYAAAERPDGHLSGLDAEDIADEAGWSGEPEALVAALDECGFIDRGPDGWVLHGWAERQPWVASSAARSDGARKAAHARWASQGACRGGTPYCDDRCGKTAQPVNKDRMDMQDNAPAMRTHASRMRDASDRNAPYPTPTPNPDPTPDPDPPHGRPVNQDICQTVAALDASPDHRPLTGASVEAIWSDAGLLGSVGAGAGPGGIGKLLALCPVHAWELREALPAARGKRSPAGYAAGVIRALRAEKRQPPPRASAPAPNGPPGAARPPTIDEATAAVARQWVEAVEAARLPPADADRMTRFVAGGAPGPDDRRALADAPTWEAYDAWAAEQRAAGQAALAALVGGLAM